MRRALLLAFLFLAACRTPTAAWGAPEPVALFVASSDTPVAGGLLTDTVTVDAVIFDAAQQALAERGIAVDPHAARQLHLRLTELDDASLVSSRAVRIALAATLTRPGAPAHAWTWGPRNVRIDLPAADRSLRPYLVEAVRRLVADGPR